MNSSKLTVISNLRPFLLLLVIINHCTPVRFTSYVNGGDFEMLNMLQNLFGHILTPSATGLFFLISGFLYFYRVDQFTLDVYKVKSSKRVKTLVVPYWYGVPFQLHTSFYIKYINGMLTVTP